MRQVDKEANFFSFVLSAAYNTDHGDPFPSQVERSTTWIFNIRK
jgi:hypothetical protein